MAKKDKVNAAYQTIMSNQQGKTAKQKSKVNPVGVALESDELERLEEIAKELNQSRHAILQYAIRDFINRYDQGEKPKTETEIVTKLKAG